MKIYVASSWRNAQQPAVVARLREAGHEVYDFRNPAPANVAARHNALGGAECPGGADEFMPAGGEKP